MSLGVTLRSRGALGAMASGRGVASTVTATPVPIPFTARTENVYERPFSRPLTTIDRALAVPPSFQSPWST